jgi:hypothetical protein
MVGATGAFAGKSRSGWWQIALEDGKMASGKWGGTCDQCLPSANEFLTCEREANWHRAQSLGFGQRRKMKFAERIISPAEGPLLEVRLQKRFRPIALLAIDT